MNIETFLPFSILAFKLSFCFHRITLLPLVLRDNLCHSHNRYTDKTEHDDPEHWVVAVVVITIRQIFEYPIQIWLDLKKQVNAKYKEHQSEYIFPTNTHLKIPLIILFFYFSVFRFRL